MIRGVEVGSSAVQYCPLDQLTGAGHTTWTLTAADMLSFARQIALAMVGRNVVQHLDFTLCADVWVN